MIDAVIITGQHGRESWEELTLDDISKLPVNVIKTPYIDGDCGAAYRDNAHIIPTKALISNSNGVTICRALQMKGDE